MLRLLLQFKIYFDQIFYFFFLMIKCALFAYQMFSIHHLNFSVQRASHRLTIHLKHTARKGGHCRHSNTLRRTYATGSTSRGHSPNIVPALTGLFAFGALGLMYLNLRIPFPKQFNHPPEEVVAVTGDRELDTLIRKIESGVPQFKSKVISSLPLEQFLSFTTIPSISDDKLAQVLSPDKAELVGKLMSSVKRLISSGRLEEGIEMCSNVVANVSMQVTGNGCERGYANYLLGECLMRRGQFDDSRPYLRNAISYGRSRSTDRFLEVVSLNSLAVASEMVGDCGNALRYLFAALDKDEIQSMMNKSGGNLSMSRVRVEVADEDLRAMSIVEGNIARICAGFGQLEYATLFACRALENMTAMRSMESERFKREVLGFATLAEMYMASNDNEFAATLLRRAREICEQHGLQEEMMRLVNIGMEHDSS